MKLDLNNLLESYGEISSIGSIVNSAYTNYKVKVLERFAKDCWNLLAVDKDVNIEKFEAIFLSDFAQEHFHRFFSGILNSYSRICQLALGKLFVDCFNRGAKYLTSLEVRTIRTLENIEDRDIETLLLVLNIIAGKNIVSSDDISLGNFGFSFGEKDFNENAQAFNELDIHSKEELRSIIQVFFYQGFFTEHSNVIVNEKSDLWASSGDRAAKSFIDLIIWAKVNTDSDK